MASTGNIGRPDWLRVREQTPQEFSERAEPFLLEREGLNQNLLGTGSRARASESSDFRLVVVEHEHEVVGAGGRGPREVAWWQLAAHPSWRGDVATAVASWISSNDEAPKSVESDPETAANFAEAYRRFTGRQVAPAMSLRVMECTHVVMVPDPGGVSRAATENDLPDLEEWYVAFDREANGGLGDPTQLRQRIRQRVLAPGSLRVSVWDDGSRVTSLVISGARTVTGEVVSLVYTPPALRGHGYAGRLVADVTREILSGTAERVFLQADARNPISNALYKKIGYRDIGVTERWDKIA